MRRGIQALGTDDIEEAVKFFTMNGIAFQRVKRGVICTKTPDQFGPCTKARGRADPGACRSDCSNRLELSLERAECKQALAALFEAYKHAASAGESMIAANIRGKLVSHSRRWNDVTDEFLQSHPEARQLLVQGA